MPSRAISGGRVCVLVYLEQGWPHVLTREPNSLLPGHWRAGCSAIYITCEKEVIELIAAHMGVGRVFSKGVTLGDFSKIFPGGSKVVKFVFSHSKVRKQPFYC